jgi:photosystem II stability/assembly factor-like uncharacterized protein
MHPTDDLVALGQVRIARAAAAGPRKGSQPTSLTDQQHLARLERFERGDGGTVLHRRPGGAIVFRAHGAIERFKALNAAEASLAREIDAL